MDLLGIGKINKKQMIKVIIILFAIVWFFPTLFFFVLNGHISIEEGNEEKKIKVYNIFELYQTVSEEIIYTIELTTKEVIYNNEINGYISIENYNSENSYMAKIFLDETLKEEIELKKVKNQFKILESDEGKKELKIYIYMNNEKKVEFLQNVYIIKPYEKQFLDELSCIGIGTHYIEGYDDINNSFELLRNLGIKNIRNSIQWNQIENNKKYNFEKIDNWFEKIKSSGINILVILFDNTSKRLGNDYQISNENELKNFLEYANEVKKYYGNKIIGVEIWNEPNVKWFSNQAMNWYSLMVQKVNCLNFNNVVSGATATPYQTEKSEQYIQEIANNGAYVNSKAFSYHVYSSSENMKWLKDKNNSHKSIINELGGFQRLYITEYGINSRVVENEDIRGERIIEQTITNEKQGIDYSFLYNFIDDFDNSQYGLIDKKNLPKKTYYAMKNYLQNTNGAEYIGTVNIAKGLEAHVYDKDGKPVIITWAENSTNNIQIDYKDFTAKDLYGKDIQPDENGKLTITTSPVYLYDVDYNYFYKAISNVATSKYDEFKEKFATEISQISGFVEKINQRQNYSQSVANTQKLMQNTAITAMKSHYELGDIILKAYEEGKLKAEPVKISSMLDMINDIGNSYEDLVTVSVNNTINSVMKTLDEANVDLSKLTTTKQKIDETENLINTNTDVEIIYPTKILQFSKDCYEKADYINSLEEQNDIKAGLIISNNLHAQLLADWANKFASIQINNNINEYIAQNPVTIEYSETNITNKSVKATIKTNAEIQITNNSNSKEYVFDQNGSFTFEYTIKGQAKQITAKVTNIDKTSPIINGVIDGKLYTSKITPTITDENIDTIKLILNGEEVKNFKSGTTLTEEGFYTLTVIDKAGNKTQISFQIMENNNQNYIIQDNIIKNISEQTKKSDFDNKLKLGITYKIARNDEEINEKDNIATGDVLTTSAGDKYTLIVTGDLNKDGKLNLKDLVKMRKYFLDGNNLDENEILAADCNFDGKINLKDLVKMRLMLLNQDATK